MSQLTERKLVVALLIWSIVVHMAVFRLTGPSNFWERYEGRRYLDQSDRLIRGEGYTGYLYTMPLYPLILAALQRLFDHSSFPLLLTHTVFGVSIVFFTYKIARLLFLPVIALLAGFLISVHPYLTKLTMQVIDTGPQVAVATCGVWLFMRAWLGSGISKKTYGFAGFVFGLGTLIRPTIAAYVLSLGVGLLVWFILKRQVRQAVSAAFVFWLLWCITMSPWWVYNFSRWQRFVPLTNSGSLQFMKGHTPYYSRVHPVYDTDHISYLPGPFASEDESDGGYLINKRQMQVALVYIKEQPVSALLTDVHKLVWLYTWHKVPRSFIDSRPRWDPELNQVIDDGAARIAPQDVIYSLYWIPILVLFLTGLVMSRRHWRKLVPLYLIVLTNALTVVMTFADTRYRLEADPYIAMWAAFGLVSLSAKIGHRCSIGWFGSKREVI